MPARWMAALVLPQLLVITFLCLAPMLLLVGYAAGEDKALLDFAARMAAIAGDSFYQVVITRTLGMAVASAALAVVLAYPIALAIARLRGGWQALGVGLTLLPLLTDLNVRTLGQIVLYGRRGFVSQLLQATGLSDGPVPILGTQLAVVLGMTQSYAPFAILAIFAVLKSQEKSLLEAAGTLGAGGVRAFAAVTLPLSLPGAAAGAVLVFLLSLSSFVIPSILGSGQVTVLSVLIYQRAMMVMDVATAAGLAIYLLALAVLVAWGVGRLTQAFESMHAPGVAAGRRTSRYQAFVAGLPDRALPGVVWHAMVVAIALFVLAPLLILLVSAFNAGPVTQFPPTRYGFDSFVRLAGADEYLQSFLISLQVALIAVLIAIPLGFFASLGASRMGPRWRNGLQTYLLLPLMIPHVVLGIALLRYANQLGVSGTLAALVAAHLLVTLPYIARIVMGSLAAIRPTLEEAALTLGATRAQAIRHVVFPLARPGIVVGALFAFVMSFTDIILNVFMASAQIYPLPVRIYSQLQDGYDLGLVAALSVVAVLFAMLCVYIIDRLVGLSEFSIV
jgi:putative spermidine/putrescine transport system permease protein